jgi:hypothetical protein
MTNPNLPAPTATAWLPWCIADSAEASPHPGALPAIPAGGAGWLMAAAGGHWADGSSGLGRRP